MLIGGTLAVVAGALGDDAPVKCIWRLFFFFQAEDGIRDYKVTGVQTCALPIYHPFAAQCAGERRRRVRIDGARRVARSGGRALITRALSIARKELLQLRRDRLTLAMMVVLPLLELLLFGYAINTDVRQMPTLVFDADRSSESRSLEHSLSASGFYDLVGHVQSHAEIERALRAGKAKVALVIPAGYASKLARGQRATLQLIVDGSDPQTVASATNTAASLVSARSTRLLLQRLGRGDATPLGIEPSTWYNPELRTAVFVVPGLVGVILTMTMVMLTSMAIARERERGTLEQL